MFTDAESSILQTHAEWMRLRHNVHEVKRVISVPQQPGLLRSFLQAADKRIVIQRGKKDRLEAI